MNAGELDELDRREFLKIAAATAAVAGLAGCIERPEPEYLPYIEQPAGIVPGEPLYYATTLAVAGYGRGALVETHTGRPTKIEGNPLHPSSLGATDVLMQASIRELYDPHRSRVPLYNGALSSWSSFATELGGRLADEALTRGTGVRVLTPALTGPTQVGLLQQFLKRFPEARWVVHDPLYNDSARQGARLALGEPREARYDFRQASVVVSLDSDFLLEEPGSVAYARQFSDARRVLRSSGHSTMSRLYVVEPALTITGATADHRLKARPRDVARVGAALAAELGIEAGGPRPGLSEAELRWVRAAAKDLEKHRGASIIIVGPAQPAPVHALAHALNARLGNVRAGGPLELTESVATLPDPRPLAEGLRELVGEMTEGKVRVLLIFGGNPVYDTPAALEFAEALKKVPTRVHLGRYVDETGQACAWHLPETHELEAWGDYRGHDGTVSFAQPLTRPIFGGKSQLEVLSMLLGDHLGGDALLKQHWNLSEPDWRRALHEGVLAGTKLAHRPAALRAAAWREPLERWLEPSAGSRLEVSFRPDPNVRDGRHASNPWLQELPKPLTQLVWGNAALLGADTAARLNARDGDELELELGGRKLRAPALIMPGHAEECVTLSLGYGRHKAENGARGLGFNAYELHGTEGAAIASGLGVSRTGGRVELVRQQLEHREHEREVVREGTLSQYHREASKIASSENPFDEPEPPTLYAPYPYDGYKWGMVIDLNSCIGCNACIAACQAENNIPTVGKDQVNRGRHMHWLRVDSYFKGDVRAPRASFQPVPCMHCEHAPCEVVCPVMATTHSAEGINEMTYNRCVGTRYCSNNCPYKVRRFNFLQYSDDVSESLKAMYNPNVTVRSRGVMEKCTYCIQRIDAARIAAGRENRRIRDGEVITACQSACPTRAIVFGDLNDEKSQVAKYRAEPVNYGLLDELGTRPRTTYLARLGNPNPEVS